jgi:hypothetical protein
MRGNFIRLALLAITATSTALFAQPASAQTSGTLVEYINTDDFPASPGGHFFYSADPAEQAAVDCYPRPTNGILVAMIVMN